MQNYEKLGAFYLGKQFDPERAQLKPDQILYDSKDLTTHAVIVGMTGSGKTGLGITLLEEAAIDGIPSLVIDPKGDMGNLLLNFPGLSAKEFRPWIELEEATRKGMTQDELAQHTAKTWKQGLADWDQPADRIQRLRDAAEAVIYTPCSDAGRQLTVLKSLDAPSAAVLQSSDAMRERVAGAVSGLLTLLGIDADPIRSREHIFLSSIVDHTWRAGSNLTLPKLIHAVQAPPFSKIGIMDLDTIYPPNERINLAMTINNVLASPTFAGWMEGEPLNIQKLLYTPEGKPRIAVLSIAHLNDRERMFFVTIFLNEVIAWMRNQSGTSSLRALLYMDELFGFLPPTANPPSKTPLLTLLKQARAFGLGLVLSTQNPVDLDYKALSNTGTWFLGRLQTERDKMRVLDGLEGASTASGVAFDRKRIETILSGLGGRVFLLNNVHENEPVVFQTRWALSYLRGPLTREQIRTLSSTSPSVAADSLSNTSSTGAAAPPATALDLSVGAGSIAAANTATSDAASTGSQDSEFSDHAPLVPTGIRQVFLSPTAGVSGSLIYRPGLLGSGKLHFVDTRSKLDAWRETALVWSGDEIPTELWDEAKSSERELDIETSPLGAAGYAALPAELCKARSYSSWKTALKNWFYQNEREELIYCPELKLHSELNESEGDFRARLKHSVSEQRDMSVEKLRKKYGPKLERLQDRVRRAEQRVDVEKGQAQSATMSAALSWGTSLLGAFLGRKAVSATSVRALGSSVRSTSRASQQRGDITRAEDNVAALTEELAELEREFEEAVDELKESLTLEELELATKEITPRKSDIMVNEIALIWLPWSVDSSGFAEPAYNLQK
jgi:hypothetical protein